MVAPRAGKGRESSMHLHIRLATTIFLLATVAGFAAETPSAQALFEKALTGDFGRKENLLRQREALVPLADAAVADAKLEDPKRGRAVGLLIVLAEIEPAAVFAPDRLDAVSKFLLTSKDWGLRFAAADFIAAAAQHGLAGNRQLLADRVRAGFQQQPELTLGRLLIALAPTNPATLSAVTAAKRMLGGRDQRLLLAAAGEPQALRALVDALALSNPANDQELDRQRGLALGDLARVRDCRAIAALVEAVSKPWPLPPNPSRDVIQTSLASQATRAVTETLKVYPGIPPPEKLPATPAAVTEWWQTAGKNLTGLDIRTSAESRWRRQLPGFDVPWVEPVPGPGSPKPEINRADRDRRDWERAADAITAAGPDGNALEFYRQAARGLGPWRHAIMVLAGRAWANKLVDADYARLQKLIADNTPALAAVQKGLACPKCEVPTLPDIKRSLPFFPSMASLQQLQLLKGVQLAHEGKARDALACCLDGIRLARHVSADRTPAATSSALRAERIACALIRRTLAATALPAHCHAWLCGELQQLGDTPVSVAAAMEEDVALLKRNLEQISLKELAEEVAKETGRSAPPEEVLTPAKDLLTDLDACQRAARAWLALPYPEALKHPMPKPAHWLAQNWMPVVGAFRLVELRTVCDSRALLIAAAVFSYHAKAGKLPGKLADLAPDSIRAVPPDPFTAQPFVYVPRPTGFRVYSIGPDLVDDHGTTPVGTRDEPDLGDIVYDFDLPAK